MCRTNFAMEDIPHGNDMVDSVVLRIMIHQDDCICRVNIENQMKLIHIGLGKYRGLTDSAPEGANCGFAVDITHIPGMSTGNAIAPIECLDNVTHRTIPLLLNYTLQLKSRIINDTFTRGYCMQIQRGKEALEHPYTY